MVECNEHNRLNGLIMTKPGEWGYLIIIDGKKDDITNLPHLNTSELGLLGYTDILGEGPQWGWFWECVEWSDDKKAVAITVIMTNEFGITYFIDVEGADPRLLAALIPYLE